MAIKPKFTLSGNEPSPKAGKQFTDREEFLAAFYNAFDTKVKDEHKILVYYGVGGIGKTTLRKELSRRVSEEKPDTVWTAIDLDTPTYREQETSLFVLRNSLTEKFKINFPSFDIAYTVYWQKTHPQTPLTKENFPLLTGADTVVAGIMRVVGEIPYAKFVPQLTKAFLTGKSVFREWWRKRGEKELANLPALEPKEISERMPMFWASDLKDFLEEKGKQAVIFLDTYEALWENVSAQGGFFMRDEWIRELVSHLPEVIWVITGREKLRWNEQDEDWNNYIEQHLLGRLSDDDSKYLLKTCGVEKEDVQNVIVTASKGIPHFLDLAVDTYYEINSKYKREPEAKDFGKTQHDVLERFLRYLDKTEIQTLNVLSAARIWDSDIFSMLVTEFKTGYPIMNMNELFRFSFINEGDLPETWTMHDLMRETLQMMQKPDVLKLVHLIMYEYYRKKLENINPKYISSTEKQSLVEAFYHGKYSLQPKEFSNWFINISKIFLNAAEHKILTSLFEELYEYLKKLLGIEDIETTDVQNRLSISYIIEGKYKQAEEHLIEALRIREKTLGKEHNEVANLLNTIAILYSKQGNYNEEEIVLKRALEIKLKVFDSEHPELIETYRLLASLYDYLGRFDEAESYFTRTIKLIEKKYGSDSTNLGFLFNNLGLLYAKSARYEEAKSLFLKTLEILEKNLGTEHNFLNEVLLNLANLYADMEEYTNAENLYLKSLKMTENIHGSFHPDVAIILNNIGSLYLMQKKYNDAKSYYERVLIINENFLGSEHTEVAAVCNNLAYLYYLMNEDKSAISLYRKAYKIYRRKVGYNNLFISNIMGNFAAINRRKKKYKNAIKLLNNALQINESILGSESQYVGRTYKDFGDLYEDMGDFTKSLEYYKKALPILIKSLGEDHSEVIYISNKISELNAKVLN